MSRPRECNIPRVEAYTGGCCIYGTSRLCCKDCEDQAVCIKVCAKAYELGTCKYEEQEREGLTQNKLNIMVEFTLLVIMYALAILLMCWLCKWVMKL